MKNKKLLFATALIALTSLAACSGGDSGSLSSIGPSIFPEADANQDINNTSVTYPDELLLNHRMVSILVEEEYELKPIKQFNYDGRNLVYESKDPTIATVDENGKVTGVASGETEIVASDKNNPNFSSTVPVIGAIRKISQGN